jgi:hypothetical protein
VGDLVVSRNVVAGAGSRQTIQIPADLMQTGLRSGFCEISAKTGEKILYQQVIPFVVDGSVRKPPASGSSTPYTQPFGLTASYAPLSKKLVIRVDRYYMQTRASVAGGRAQLIDPRNSH